MEETGETPDFQGVLRARIALLATAIGGPDYTSSLDPPPYKLGDDCLACLQDLKRWFKLVDDQQNTWDVAMAAAEHKILTDDLIPIMVDWENKSSLEAKLLRKNKNKKADNIPVVEGRMKNKVYHDKVALHCLQLLVLMTWPLIITEQSTTNQVKYYTDLKKYQLVYKKAILSTENGKVLKAIIRLVLNVMKIDRISRTPRDNLVIKLALNFFRNVISIEPGELMITNKKKQSGTKGISSIDTLPPNVSMEDISLNSVVNSFHQNKVFSLILTLASSLNSEFDQDFINIPILEIMFFLTKDINQTLIFKYPTNNISHSKYSDGTHNNKQYSSRTEMELSDLLNKEFQMKKTLIKNTSSRHSRFGAMLSIQTNENTRLTISGSQNILNDSSALDKLDNRKKWNKRITRTKDDPLEEGLPNSLLNSHGSLVLLLQESTIGIFRRFINDFMDSGFNTILHSVTNYMTTEQDKLVTIEQIEYLLFFAWFIKYQTLRCGIDSEADLSCASEALRETSFILVSHLLRASFETKNWIVVHAAMIAFNELLMFVSNERNNDADQDDIDFIISRLFSDERIHLLSNLPRTATRHSPQYMKSCIDLTHTVLKTLEQYQTKDHKLIVEGKKRRHHISNFTEEDVKRLMEDENIDREEAIDILTPTASTMEVNFEKVQNSYINDATIETYINFLGRFRELDNDQIKKIIAFFHRAFIQAKEESFFLRIDLIVLLRDMLADDGIERTARVRKHVEQFSNYYLQRLKYRLKKSPSWIIELLFPSLHDSEIAYFQRYGERKVLNVDTYYGVPPSIFKTLPDEEMLPDSVLKDMKFGILVSTLLDDSKLDFVEELANHIAKTIDIFKSWLTVNVQGQNETENPPNEIFRPNKEIGLPTLLDRDYRALLQLVGYVIPKTRVDACFLPGTVEIPDLEESLNMVKKYMTNPYETPNGQTSSSYLIRPRKEKSSINSEDDGWTGRDDYDYDDPSIIRDDEINDDDYFKDLDNSSTKHSGNIKRGIATSKKKKKNRRSKRSNLPTFDTEDDTPALTKKQNHIVSSKEYIVSDDEDESLNPIFFENEIYMRWLLDKHQGQLSSEKFNLFGKFAEERMANNGLTTSNFTELFDGPVPDISSLNDSSYSNSLPDKTLSDLNTRVEEEILHAKEVNASSGATSENDTSAAVGTLNNESTAEQNLTNERNSKANSDIELSDDEYTSSEDEAARTPSKRSRGEYENGENDKKEKDGREDDDDDDNDDDEDILFSKKKMRRQQPTEEDE